MLNRLAVIGALAAADPLDVGRPASPYWNARGDMPGMTMHSTADKMRALLTQPEMHMLAGFRVLGDVMERHDRKRLTPCSEEAMRRVDELYERRIQRNDDVWEDWGRKQRDRLDRFERELEERFEALKRELEARSAARPQKPVETVARGRLSLWWGRALSALQIRRHGRH